MLTTGKSERQVVGMTEEQFNLLVRAELALRQYEVWMNHRRPEGSARWEYPAGQDVGKDIRDYLERNGQQCAKYAPVGTLDMKPAYCRFCETAPCECNDPGVLAIGMGTKEDAS